MWALGQYCVVKGPQSWFERFPHWFYLPVKAKMKPFQPSLLFWSCRKTWFEIVKENLNCLVFSHSCFHIEAPLPLVWTRSTLTYFCSAFMQMWKEIKGSLSDPRSWTANYEPAGVGGLEEYVENGCSYVYLMAGTLWLLRADWRESLTQIRH